MNFDDRFRYQISISLTDDNEVSKMNKKYRNKDSSTDVLSFSINKDLGDNEIYVGDVVVNLKQAEKQAKDRGCSVEEEISDLVKHGVLHLLGIHHDGDDH